MFTVTADRAAVKAAVQSGDELRLSRTTGELEIVPTGLPGLVDRLQQAIEAGYFNADGMARDPELELLHGPEFDVLVQHARRNAAAARATGGDRH